MPLTGDQSKYLLIGGGLGALAFAAGYAIFGRKSRTSAFHDREALHDRRRRHHRYEQGQPVEVVENERGEYGERHRHHHGEHDRG